MFLGRRTCSENLSAPGSVTMFLSDGGILELRTPPHAGRCWDHLRAAGFRVWETKLRNALKLFAPDRKPILAEADSP